MTRLICSEESIHRVGQVEAGGECPECKAPVVEFSREVVFAQRIRRQALQEAPRPKGMIGPVRVKIAVCVGCGSPVWRGTETSRSGRDQVVVDDSSSRDPVLCRGCEAIRYRYPELYFWINNTEYWRVHRMEILEQLGERGRRLPEEEPPSDVPPPPPGPDTRKKRKAKRGR